MYWNITLGKYCAVIQRKDLVWITNLLKCLMCVDRFEPIYHYTQRTSAADDVCEAYLEDVLWIIACFRCRIAFNQFCAYML